MLGLIRVDLRSSRTSLRGFSAVWAVLSAVLMVLTCHSMMPLDFGEMGGGHGVFYVVVQENLCEFLR